MRQSVIADLILVAGLAVAAGGCDIGQRTRVESLYTGNAPAQIAVDDTHIYWTESTTVNDTPIWTIKSVSKKALPPSPPAELEHGPLITVEAQTVWFADTAGTVSRRDPDATVTPMFMPTDAAPVALARDDANIYEGIAIGNPATSWEIWAIPRDGSDPFRLTSDVTDTFTLEDVVTDGEGVYFSVGSHSGVPQGEIRQIAVGGGDVEVLATADTAEPRTLRKVDGGLVWYGVQQVLDTGEIKGALFRTDYTNPTNQLIQVAGPTSLAVDDQFVYWVDAGAAEIWVERIAQVGGHRTSLVPLSPAGASTALTVDDTYVYWSDLGAGANMPKPGLNRMHKN